MKQVIQSYKTGSLSVREVPPPRAGTKSVVVRTTASLISIGTERSIIELGKQSLLGKARQRPDLVKRFLEKAKHEGLLKTFREAMGRLDAPTPLGYSSAGIVTEVGNAVHELSVGDRVACIGAGYASHAEYSRVPIQLCAPIPDNVSDQAASFGMLGTIAMHGYRTAATTPGAVVAIVGMGLLGILAGQIARAYGHPVVGYDPDSAKVDLAHALGMTEVVDDHMAFRAAVDRLAQGRGADTVIVTAAGTDATPIELAVDVAMYGARVVVVGVADIHPSRNEMWHKEVEIVVSRASGPGALDPVYEDGGIDYPAGFVRWTERRNLEEFLRLVAERRIQLEPMISHRVSLDSAEVTYRAILKGEGGPYIGVVIEYDTPTPKRSADRAPAVPTPIARTATLRLGVVGAGLFGSALLIPALSRIAGVTLVGIATRTGATAEHTARKYRFEYASAEAQELLLDASIDAVVIATPHSTHADLVCRSLEAGKHVFVEKPLCISHDELERIRRIADTGDRYLMVGYNRRYSAHARRMRDLVVAQAALATISYRVNAGFVPADHWVHSESEGRSRILGEMVHFFDLISYVTGSPIVRVSAERVAGDNKTIVNCDNVVVTMKTRSGAIANLVYSASGNRAYPREQIEIHVGGMTIASRDFRVTRVEASGRAARGLRTRNQDMGYRQELQRFVEVCSGKAAPDMTRPEIYNSTRVAFMVEESLSLGEAVNL